MSDIGTPITETIPAVGTSGTTYASNINLFLTEVKNRLEAKVPRTSLEAGDLDLAGYDLQNALTVGFSAQAGVPAAPTGTLQMYSGELYWVGSGGVVKITNGATLNAGSIGGITGDYGSPNPAEFRFVDADQEFYAYDNYAGGAWAKLWARNLDLAAAATGTTRVRLNFDGPGSYTLTLPDAAPASTTVVTMNSSGELLASARTITASVSPALWTTGTSTSIGFDGFIKGNVGWTGPDATNPLTSTLFIPVSIPVGATITGYKLWYNKATADDHSFQVILYKSTGTGTVTAEVTDTINTNAPGATSLDKTGLSYTTAAGEAYNIRIHYSAGANPSSDAFYSLDLTYTTTV